MTSKALLAAALATVALTPATADAARRPDMKSCGDEHSLNGFLVDDVLARRVTCKKARRIARRTPRFCGVAGTCSVLGYFCFTARAGEELFFARCTKPAHGDELYHVVRFDFGL
jgi:hypothetical protein